MFIAKGYKGIYYLYYKDESTGNKRKISTKTKQKSKANEFLQTFKAKDRTLISQKASPTNLSDLKNEIINYVSYNLNKSTVKLYERCFNILFKTITNKPIRYITLHDIEKFKESRLNEVSVSTVNIDLRTCKAIFNLAVKWKWLDNNPVNGVKLLKVPQKDILCFTEDELNLIFDTVTNTTVSNVVKFALYTGCRLNEILNIQFKDINLAEKTIAIRNKADFKTKSGKVRFIPISNKLLEVIQKMLKQDENILKLYNPEQYLFNKNNFKYNKDYISKSFKKSLRKVGIPERFHFHCLRHTFITKLIKNGVNINYVKELAGHSNISTTMHYIHIATEDLRNAVNQI